MLETVEQSLVIQWSKYHKKANLLFSIPNGTNIPSHKGRAKAKAEGLTAGIPDLFLPVANKGWNGLFIEMKKPKDKTVAGTASKVQVEKMEELTEQGYLCVICIGHEAAIRTITDYLK